MSNTTDLLKLSTDQFYDLIKDFNNNELKTTYIDFLSYYYLRNATWEYIKSNSINEVKIPLEQQLIIASKKIDVEKKSKTELIEIFLTLFGQLKAKEEIMRMQMFDSFME
jgi:hypothetical protein